MDPRGTGTLKKLKLKVDIDSHAFDSQVPGTRRHIKAALKLGATIEEIMEGLKLCVVQRRPGVQYGSLSDTRRRDCEDFEHEIGGTTRNSNERSPLSPCAC